MEGGSTEIGRQRNEERRMEEAKLSFRSTGVHGRAQKERSTGPGRPTEVASLSGRHGRPGRSIVAWVGQPAGRPTGAAGLSF